jgi:hypothetical protein
MKPGRDKPFLALKEIVLEIGNMQLLINRKIKVSAEKRGISRHYLAENDHYLSLL